MRADLTPPQDLDAERSVLGSMLMSKDAISDTVEILKGREFYRPAHETIFDAILSLYSRGEPADAITVGAELERTDQLDRIGDRVYLADLLGSVSIAENASYYARIVSDKAVLRRLVDASMRISQMAYQGQGDVADTVDAAQQELYDVAEGRTSDDYHVLSELLESTWDELETIESRGDAMGGIPTGFADLDELTNGFQPGQMLSLIHI